MKRKIITLEKKLANILGKEGVQLDSEISSDVLEIMTQQQPMIDQLPEDSFKRESIGTSKRMLL